MQPLAVDLRLLYEAREAASLRLAPGRGLMARVVHADGSGRGTLNIAGALIEAELPRSLRTGEQMRLVVRALDAHRVVLELPQSTAPPTTPPAAIPLPGGGTLRVLDDDNGSGQSAGGRRQAGVHAVALSYDTPSLGTLDLRFELHAGALRVNVAAAPGDPLHLAGEHADELREALGAAADRQVSVTVSPRREPLDLYA